MDPFLTLHRPDGVEFYIRVEDVRLIESILVADDPDPQANGYINDQRYVLETPEEIRTMVVERTKG